MTKKKRGGAGRGQGRKPKADGEKFIKRQIHFRPDQLEKLAGQNLSVAVRNAIDSQPNFKIMADAATTQIWEKHFGNSAAVPFGKNVEPFLNELADDIEIRDCQDISDRQAFGLDKPGERERMAAMMKSYAARNGREMVLVHRSRD